MPLVYQQNINAVSRMAVWHITEDEHFFLAQVPLQKTISHWHKRLQHLAGRLLLKELYPDFPVSMIRIADTKKPYLADEPFHFSISHCGDYAAAIVSKEYRVGVDVEQVNEKIKILQKKFLSEAEMKTLLAQCSMTHEQCLTLCWSVKESVFKWWGRGSVDFKRGMVVQSVQGDAAEGKVHCLFKNETELVIHYLAFNDNFLTWVLTDH
ncbi:MAG TPA: 4'-phosphopantetheinyl transferase superfamily protein [Ferruginibacter sp.]|nr:4-phosphopantetheinyl transferase [Chitinophagaceae bacterium]HRI23826.1 4'-phosphopantetheinyl transferase superfamily protein [Ferruginibacter sp.]